MNDDEGQRPLTNEAFFKIKFHVFPDALIL